MSLLISYAPLTYAQQQQLIKKYLAAEIKNQETAAALVMSKSAQRLRQLTATELRRFKKGPKSRGNFHKAVKRYDFPKAKGTMGPASYVRLGVPWIHIFEEGGNIRGSRGALIILLDTGAKLGFNRVKPFGWQQVWNQIKDHAAIIPASDGYFIGLNNIKTSDGKPTLIYKIQKAPVRVPKKLNFYDNAEKLADKMPDLINKLIK